MGPKIQLPMHFRDWNTLTEPNPAHTPRCATRPKCKRKCAITTILLILVVVIIATVVPLAVILPNKGKVERRAGVLLPLYIYPEGASWAPLFSSLTARPNLKFTVIINPSNGPGSSLYPDEHYTTALNLLANYSNVEKVGYVRTGYASRNLSEVISEVNIYANWSLKNQAFAMDGVFFDESPHQFTQEAVDYMLSASRAVKDTKEFQGSKMVIRNPGVIPDGRFTDPNTDVNVVFEQSYDEYKLKAPELSTINGDRSHRCYMVHSLPAMGKGEMQGFVDILGKRAQYLFVTNSAERYYERFGSDWSYFISAIAA